MHLHDMCILLKYVIEVCLRFLLKISTKECNVYQINFFLFHRSVGSVEFLLVLSKLLIVLMV